MARASSARSIVKNKPRRAGISLGSSLFCEADQSEEQDNLYWFHAVEF